MLIPAGAGTENVRTDTAAETPQADTVLETVAGSNDFTYSNGVLTAYSGTDAAVTVPSGLTGIAEEVF